MVRAKEPTVLLAEEQRQFEKQLYEELAEMDELHRLEVERAKRKYRLAVKEWKRRRDEKIKEEELKREKDEAEKRAADEAAGKISMSKEDQELLADKDELDDFEDDGATGDQWLRDSVSSMRKAERKKKRQQEKEKSKEEVRISVSGLCNQLYL
jgi:hypothetical protein